MENKNFESFKEYFAIIETQINPARVACEVFSTDTRKTLSIQCYTHVGVGQN